jgi:lipopolysaccharide assembly outer membrane protein LptD (OstA)
VFILSLAFLALAAGRLKADTIPETRPDTLLTDTLAAASGEILEAQVKYTSRDSIRFDLPNKKVYLYGQAEINYEAINLKADFIEIDLDKNAVFATFLIDSAGNETGVPVFKEGDQTFKSKALRYNFRTKKGFINRVVTEDGYGYLQGEKVKKMDNDEINISKGFYTTCDHVDHPHFEFRYNKSKVIPKKRIVTGPAYLVIEDVPTPLFIPFGWFPNKQGQRSGIVLPTYGESANRGFAFENLGYYWSINDHLDLQALGDIYTKGSWSVKPTLRYRWRYRFNGSLNLSYAINITGVKETPNYDRKRDFAVRWSHKQDPKARPKSMFSADVNIVSSTFSKYNPTSTEDYLSNTFRSSIAYQTNFAGKYFLTINASHDQNTLTHVVNVTLPELSFSVNRFYPFRGRQQVGKLKWYDNISMNYALNARNTVSAPDSTFFTSGTLDDMRNGIKHSIPISSPVKLLKYFTWTNSLAINDRMYFESIRRDWVDTLFVNNDTILNTVVTDTVPGFVNAFDFSFSSSLTTKIYGMYTFGKKFPVQAIRHVLTPSVSFSYTPDFGSEFWGYWDSYYNGEGKEFSYSIFEGSLFGSPPGNKSGRIGFSFANNLEMKIRSRKDTVTGMKKMVLIDNFTASFSYDLAKDSLNWSRFTLSGRTRLFENLDLSYRAEWDPYILDSAGKYNLAQTEWAVNHRLLRKESTNWTVSLNWRLSSTNFSKEKKELDTRVGTEAEREEIALNPENYIDWSVPWDVTFSYSFNYNVDNLYPNYIEERDEKIVQTLGLNGNVSITPKWKVAFVTGWDFENNDLSYTSLSVYRDLHCWEMRFNWVPTGFRKSWNFAINAKASILQDLKLTKKKDFRDN